MYWNRNDTYISNQRQIVLFECKIDNIPKYINYQKHGNEIYMEYETCWSDAVDNEIDSLQENTILHQISR